MKQATMIVLLLSCWFGSSVGAVEVDEIVNYVEYSTEFSSGGQPNCDGCLWQSD